MAKIYSAPENIEKPKFNILECSIDELEAEEEAYIGEVKKQLQAVKPNEEYCGEVLKFPQGDGYAMYMIFTVNPPQLVHLPLGDCWQFPYIEDLTSDSIMSQLNTQKALEKLFSK